MSSENEVRVEAYLDQVLAPLTRPLSPFHRNELRRELRAHLWERVEAYLELGQSDETAVTEALRQFGGAEDFLRQWKRDWITVKPRDTVRQVWESGRQALRPTLIGLAAACLPIELLDAVSLYRPHLGQTYPLVNTAFIWLVTMLLFFVLPVVIGVRHGARTPGRVGAGMLAALGAEGIAASLLYQGISVVWPEWLVAGNILAFVLFLITAWLPLAGGAAAISGWVTRRRNRISV